VLYVSLTRGSASNHLYVDTHYDLILLPVTTGLNEIPSALDVLAGYSVMREPTCPRPT